MIIDFLNMTEDAKPNFKGGEKEMIATIWVTVLTLPQIFAATTLPFEAAISRIEVTANSRKSTTITATQSHQPS